MLLGLFYVTHSKDTRTTHNGKPMGASIVSVGKALICCTYQNRFAQALEFRKLLQNLPALLLRLGKAQTRIYGSILQSC